MRHALFVIALGIAPQILGGCAFVRGLGDYTFSDGKNLPPDEEEKANPPSSSPSSPVTPQSAQGCEHHSECFDPASSSPRICVKATHACASVLSAECTRFVGDPSNDEAIFVGAVLSDNDGTDGDALERAVVLAAEEINSANGAGGLPPTTAQGKARPLVVVGCNASADVLSTTGHLVGDLHVPAVIGPTSGEGVVEATQQVTVKGGTLLMTPTSPVSAISNLADEGLTWRATPSDAQRAKLVIEQMNELETLLKSARSLASVKLGIVAGTDSGGVSAREAIAGTLILNGRFIGDPANTANVSVDTYEVANEAALADIATTYANTFKPDIVFITAREQVASFIVPFEKAMTTARVVNRPYYVVTDAAKTEELIEIIASSAVPSDTRRRIRGVGIKPDASSAPVLADFTSAYVARYGAEPLASLVPAAAHSYDMTYAIAYAIAATPDVPTTGKSIAQGLRTLGVGDVATVGAKDARSIALELASRKSVSLRGTFATMSWDLSGDIAAGTLDVWCIGTKDGLPAFGSSGLTMDVQTQVVGGGFVQCQ